MDYQPDENEIIQIYEWVDSINLSRPKKNIARDFSDAVLLAELIKNQYPKLVELHNYPAAHSVSTKRYNWITLNNKVLKKIGIQLSKNEIEDIISLKQGSIESVLKRVYNKLNNLDLKENILPVEKSAPVENNNPKSHFYNGEIKDRDRTIEELKKSLEIAEMKLRKSEDEKVKLTIKMKEVGEKMRQYGIY